jgi:restriction-modification system family protein
MRSDRPRSRSPLSIEVIDHIEDVCYSAWAERSIECKARDAGKKGRTGRGMALSLDDHRAMLRGFEHAGYICTEAPGALSNPVQIEWHIDNQVRRYRLWAFQLSPGGQNRDEDERRIQITNGPPTMAAFDRDGATDLLIGYSDKYGGPIVCGFDRRWLENWTKKREQKGSGGSPGVGHFKQNRIDEALAQKIVHWQKLARFPYLGLAGRVDAEEVCMIPDLLPAYLLNHGAMLQGTMTADEAEASTPKPAATTIVDYCRQQGFPFEAEVIARYIAAFLTKPFVILAGVSGTGKSKLAELVAEFYTRSAGPAAPSGDAPAAGDTFVFASAKGLPDRTRFALVAVRPDWIDNQSILGFVNPITSEYESTQALDLILRARQAIAAAAEKFAAPRYFMLLDEMNLARVEHYFSDWLACTESRRLRPDGGIVQQAVPLHRSEKLLETMLQETDGSKKAVFVPASLELPTNVVVTGTVNVDETTYGFSPKVLDRAMVLEFDTVDLDRLRTGRAEAGEAAYRFPDPLRPFRLASKADYEQLPAAAHRHLVALNAILAQARLHLGYRAANEIALFMRIYNDILPVDETDGDWQRALDAAVLQKVLPRLSGNKARLEAPLEKVCSYLRDLNPASTHLGGEPFDPDVKAELPKSYRRAVEMLETLREFGFVSFFK